MRSRPVHSYKILAVAISAGLGCTTAEPPRQETKPQAQVAPTPSAAAPAAEHAPPPPDDKVDPKLLELRTRLELAGKSAALADEKTFRPLCDADGYPLVGNLMRKSPTQPFGPTAFCSEIRAKKRS